MPFRDPLPFARLRVPGPQRPVVSGGIEPIAGRTEADRVDVVRMSGELPHELRRPRGLPETDRIVPAAGREQRAVRRERDREGPGRMRLQVRPQLPGLEVPPADGAVAAARDEGPA